MLLLSADFSQVKTICKIGISVAAPHPRYNVELVCDVGTCQWGVRLNGRNFASGNTDHSSTLQWG